MFSLWGYRDLVVAWWQPGMADHGAPCVVRMMQRDPPSIAISEHEDFGVGTRLGASRSEWVDSQRAVEVFRRLDPHSIRTAHFVDRAA